MLIGDVIEYAATSSEPPKVAFFHFDAEHADKRTHFNAWRALNAQFFHKFKRDKDIIDTISMLMDMSGSGQFHASDDEVEALLRIFIDDGPTYLLFDGVDECINHMTFLKSLYDICKDSDTRILFLSRPTVSFPLSYKRSAKGVWKLRLGASENLMDIKTYLDEGISHIAQNRLVAGDLSAETIVQKLSERANGMFLWAKLMTRYLSCPALTPLERLEAIEELNMLQGLEAIYVKILQVLETRYQKERALVYKILKWMVVALRPMKIGELHTALAISPGQPTGKTSYIVDFEQCLVVSCLGLVEIRMGHVHFIHSSVQEFLLSKDPSTAILDFDQKWAHLSLAMVCLSFLAYDVPRMPLSVLDPMHMTDSNDLGSVDTGLPNQQLLALRLRRTYQNITSEETSLNHISNVMGKLVPPAARVNFLDNELPFVGYASLFWARHCQHSFGDFFEGFINTSDSKIISNVPIFAELLSTFLVSRGLLTTWVEGCYLYGEVPDISNLVNPVSKLGQHNFPTGSARREYLWMVAGLHQASAALRELGDVHSYLLFSEPAEIWGPMIMKATDPEFWPMWSPSVKLNKSQRDEKMIPVEASEPQASLGEPSAMHQRSAVSALAM
jgi:hypothetical protein